MISKETCVKIYHCHKEIEKSKKLMEDMAEVVKKDKDKKEPNLYNAFGEATGLRLGVPSGSDSHTLYGVSIDLGVKVIEEHIRQNQQRLVELMAIAKIELSQ